MMPILALLMAATGLALVASRVRWTHKPQGGTPVARTGIETANEGLLDHELLSADPIGAWLSRYLTPTAR